jgi:cytosine deaminase
MLICQGEAYLKQRGIEVVNMESKECQDLMDLFIKEKPEIWYVDALGYAEI